MEFWKNRKVLITGHTGFVGTWLCLVLQRYGVKLIGLALEEERNSLYAKVKDYLNIESYYGDLRDYEFVNSVLRESRPDIIIHLAAYGFVRECIMDPSRTFDTNIGGTKNLLEAIREVDAVRSVVIASSDKVYKNNDSEFYLFEENDPLGGIDPYSCSKTCEDLLAQSYYDTYLKMRGISLAILRPSNILGGGDHIESRLIPSILKSICKGERPELRNPDAIRPWQHILDAVDAYLVICEYLWEKNQLLIYNVGPEKKNIISVSEIADILLEFNNEISADVHVKREEKNMLEKQYLGLKIDKIKNELDWRPKRDIRQTLRDVYDFRIDEGMIGAYESCIKQIQRFDFSAGYNKSFICSRRQ